MDRKALRRTCLSFKGATMDHPWDPDHDAFKIGGKMFAVIGAMGGLSFKASAIAFEVLTETGKAQPAQYLARGHWVQVDDWQDWPDQELRDYLERAYELIAAKLTKAAKKELGLA
jgi:predicted DNA-binding protein (MmcQ/YjbR family)